MGSGILDDDQEYNMVVANFLQKNTLFVSVVQVRLRPQLVRFTTLFSVKHPFT